MASRRPSRRQTERRPPCLRASNIGWTGAVSLIATRLRSTQPVGDSPDCCAGGRIIWRTACTDRSDQRRRVTLPVPAGSPWHDAKPAALERGPITRFFIRPAVVARLRTASCDLPIAFAMSRMASPRAMDCTSRARSSSVPRTR